MDVRKVLETAKRNAFPSAQTADGKTVNHETLAKLKGRVLQLGWGGVGRAMLPLVLRHIDCEAITVVEKDDNTDLFEERHGGDGVDYVVEEIVEGNVIEVLSKYVGQGGLLIDLAVNIDCETVIDWCHKNGVLYINTSIERWATEPDEVIPDLAERTLWQTHREVRACARRWRRGGPTCLMTHGANPGLVSHFTKAALLDIAKSLQLDVPTPKRREQWAALMRQVGVKVIHISERDTQIIDRPKQVGEFVSSWSCEGFWAEGRAPAEMGWGTHEPKTPDNGALQADGRAAYLKQPGVATLVHTWVPLGGSIDGFLIQHSESITISQYFSAMENGKVVYCPTVHYAYQPIDAALASVHEFRGRKLEMQHVTRIAKDEVVSGIDELGVLLMGHKKNAWWYGSQLGIDEARRLIPFENATSLQVVGSMLGAIVWGINNPTMGYVEPEDLPHEEILRVARPYLGPIASVQSDWRPIHDHNELFARPMNKAEPWAFENFRAN